MGRPVKWTEEKIKDLKKYFPSIDNEIVATSLNVSAGALRLKASQLRLKKAKWYWHKNWEKLVLQKFGNHSPEEIAAMLKNKFGAVKSRWSVINKYRKLTGKKK